GPGAGAPHPAAAPAATRSAPPAARNRRGRRASPRLSLEGRGDLSRIRHDAHGDDAVGVADGLAALDPVDVLHAFHDLAPDRVLLVEEAGVVEADEELG